MKILISITYYYPNISGLTIYAQTLAEELVQRGHQVTVLTSQHLKNLPREENIDGVSVVRIPVNLHLGKGVIMLKLLFFAIRYILWADIVNCHIPQFESSIVAIISRLLGKKIILTHHTDLSGWKGILNQISEKCVNLSQFIAGLLSDKIVVYTKDYADSSIFLQKFKSKLEYIYPPIKTAKINHRVRMQLKKKIGKAKYLIGFSGRIAKQKGIPNFLEAIPYLKSLNSFKLVLAGPYKGVIGENYFKELKPLIDKYNEKLIFLGPLKFEELSSFYSLIDVLVLPSNDRLESFGFVQVEAMLQGCPVVTMDLPGVRVPIQKTGMGRVVAKENSTFLAKAIIEVVKNRKAYTSKKNDVKKIFDYRKTLEKYEKLIT